MQLMSTHTSMLNSCHKIQAAEELHETICNLIQDSKAK